MSASPEVAQSQARAFYYLAKPGIIYGNAISASAGFLFASGKAVSLPLMVATLSGTAMVIATGCVLNNLTDRGIDRAMQRTKHRALVDGRITVSQALVFAAVLGVSGFTILMLMTNAITVYLGLLGLYFYVVVYGLAKRRTPYGTLLGSVAGSTPILAGYTAVTGRIDAVGLVLFAAMACWQMPHFYAIALYRLKDYQAAHIPVLPSVRSTETTRLRIIAYIIAFTLLSASLAFFANTGLTYVVVVVASGSFWLWQGLTNFRMKNTTLWARMMFKQSLVTMLVFSIALSIIAIAP